MNLVGRDPELARLRAFLADVESGRGGSLMLRGDPGIGKTALLGWAAQQLPAARVLQATGVESEVELGFSGLAELCLPIIELLDEIPPPQRQALQIALALDSGPRGDRFALAMGAASLLRAAAAAGPVLVLVDDAQWLDEASLDALGFALRRLHDVPLGMLLAARTGELELPGIATLDIGGLDAADARALVRQGGAVSADVAERLVALSAGNPLALRELSAAVGQDGLGGLLPLDPPLRLGPVLERAFARRLDRLSEACRETLLIASAGAAHPLSTIASQLSPDGLAEAEDGGLLRISGDRLLFRHPLVRSAIYHSAIPSAQRAAHRRLAEVVPGDEARGWHLAAAAVGLDETAAAALEVGGRDVLRRSGYAPAAAAFRRAASLTPDDAERTRRLHLAAEAATLGGLADMAAEILAEVEQHTLSPRQRAELDLLHGLLRIHAGETPTELLAEAGRRIAGEDPGRAALMLAWASEAAVYGRRWEVAASLGAEAAALVAGTGDAAEFWAQWIEGVALTSSGRVAEGHAALRRAVATFVQHGHGDDPRLLANYAVALMYLDDFAGGLAAAERASAAARQLGATPTLLFAASFELVGRVVVGDWERAEAEAAELHTLAVDTDNRSEREDFVWTQAVIAAARGDAERHAALLAASDPARDPRVALTAGLLALGADAPADAVVALAPLVRPGAFAGYADPDLSPFDLAEAHLRCGDTGAARGLLESFDGVADRSWVRAALLRCRALAREGDWQAWCEESRAEFARLGFAFEEARTDLYLGELLRRDRRRGEAREPLRRAEATFERLGAHPWARRAQASLRAAGEAAAGGEAVPSGVLSRREDEVARLAAAGRSNKEIGASLFVSPRTVEIHLAAAFRKLGVRRRAELAAVLAAVPEPGLHDAPDTSFPGFPARAAPG